MDATQKQKMWKVAFVHFPLSVFFLMIVLKYGIVPHSFSGGYTAILQGESRVVWLEAWASLWKTIFFILQPLLWLLNKFGQPISVILPKLLLLVLCLISIPLWSVCFSWLFVKLDNWLNHFPVLGKRIF
jgi:hypothetical protein